MTETYVPIEGVSCRVLGEVAYLGNNLFKSNYYAQNNNLKFLPSKDVNKIARAVKPEKPTKKFTKYAVDNSELNEETVENAYDALHTGIWKKYWIRAKEILVWRQSGNFSHPKVIGAGNSGAIEAWLINDYKIVNDKIDISEYDQPIKIDWPTKNSSVTNQMIKVLGAPKNTKVWVDTNLDYYEGLRALVWYFRPPERPDLDSSWDPQDGVSYVGSLLGKEI